MPAFIDNLSCRLAASFCQMRLRTTLSFLYFWALSKNAHMNAGARDADFHHTEAASYLRLEERKIYEMLAEGTVPCTKATDRRLIPKAALDHWRVLAWK
jgi:excisionase family DNA binding protein